MPKNELTTIDHSQLPVAQMGNDDVYGDLAKGTEFLGRLQLYSKGDAVSRNLIPGGSFGIPQSGDTITNLSDTIDVLVLARRPKALDMTDTEALIVNFDPDSDEFKRIAAQSAEKESHCMYGPSFLVYERKSGLFLEFFCGSKSARGESKNIYGFMAITQEEIDRRGLTEVEPHGPLPMTLKSKYVKKGPYAWHVPVASKCSQPFTKLPAMAKIVAEINSFINPKAEGTEVVKEEAPKNGKKARAR